VDLGAAAAGSVARPHWLSPQQVFQMTDFRDLAARLAAGAAMAALALLALVLALRVGPAGAHEAMPEGWEYSYACCSNTDCSPVPDEAVRQTANGWQVLIAPGSHPMVPPGAVAVAAFLPHGSSRVRQSGDARKHACVSAGGTLLCVYVSPSGS
jgi:hypothetical protein